MTKIFGTPDLTIEELFDSLPTSPYYNIAWKYMEKKGIKDPNLADLFEAFHEIAKIDNIVNKKGRKNDSPNY